MYFCGLIQHPGEWVCSYSGIQIKVCRSCMAHVEESQALVGKLLWARGAWQAQVGSASQSPTISQYSDMMESFLHYG